jgi:hypothetical protein
MRSIASTCAAGLGLLAVLAMPSGAVAQEEPRHRMTIAAGATHLSHQDLIHTPFVHGGVSPLSLSIRYERAGPWVQLAEGGYHTLTSRLTEPFPILHRGHEHDNPPHRFQVIDGGYGLGRRLPAGASRSAALGAAVRVDLQATDYNYGFEPNFGYFISPSLNLWYRHELDLSAGRRLSGRAMAPLVAWVARSPYMVNDDQFIENIESGRPLTILAAFLADGELTGWDRLQRLDVSLDYHHPVLRRLDAGVSYRFGVLRHTRPRPLTTVRNSIDLTTSIRF